MRKRQNKQEVSARQKLLVLEYLKDLNATQAAIRAGYGKRSAKVTGCRPLTNANVVAEIQKAIEARAKRVKIDGDRVLREIADLGFANIGDYIEVQKDGTFFVDFSKLTHDQKAAVQEVTVEEYTEGRGKGARRIRRVRFKLADKGKSLERLGRHLGLFSDTHIHRFPDQLAPHLEQLTDEQLGDLLLRTADEIATNPKAGEHEEN